MQPVRRDGDEPWPGAGAALDDATVRWAARCPGTGALLLPPARRPARQRHPRVTAARDTDVMLVVAWVTTRGAGRVRCRSRNARRSAGFSGPTEPPCRVPHKPPSSLLHTAPGMGNTLCGTAAARTEARAARVARRAARRDARRARRAARREARLKARAAKGATVAPPGLLGRASQLGARVGELQNNTYPSLPPTFLRETRAKPRGGRGERAWRPAWDGFFAPLVTLTPGAPRAVSFLAPLKQHSRSPGRSQGQGTGRRRRRRTGRGRRAAVVARGVGARQRAGSI